MTYLSSDKREVYDRQRKEHCSQTIKQLFTSERHTVYSIHSNAVSSCTLTKVVRKAEPIKHSYVAAELL